MTNESEKWQKVWAEIESRRIELGLSSNDLYGKADLSETTFRKMRVHGTPVVRPASQRRIEIALQWEHGSIAAILAGNTPAAAPAGHATIDDLAAAIAELTKLVRKLVSQ